MSADKLSLPAATASAVFISRKRPGFFYRSFLCAYLRVHDVCLYRDTHTHTHTQEAREIPVATGNRVPRNRQSVVLELRRARYPSVAANPRRKSSPPRRRRG